MIRIFDFYLSKGIILLLAVEAILLSIAVPLGVQSRFLGIPWTPNMGLIWTNSAVFMVLGLAALSAFGLYRRDFEEGVGSMLFRVGASFLLILAGMALVYYVFPGIYLGRGALGAACAIGLGAIALGRVIFFRWADLDILKHRVLVLGTGTRAAKVMDLLRERDNQLRMHVVGFLPLQGVHHFVDHSRILLDQANLTALVDKYQIDEIVIAIRERRGGGLPVNELLDCRLKGVQVIELSTFFERERGQLQLESLNASWMVLSNGFQQGVVRDVVKRLFDLLVSFVILLVSLPIIALAMIGIAWESGFPILYRQERVGQGDALLVAQLAGFVENQPDVVVRPQAAADFFAQECAHGFAADAPDDFAEDVADVDGVVGALRSRRPSGRLLLERADMHGPVEPRSRRRVIAVDHAAGV